MNIKIRALSQQEEIYTYPQPYPVAEHCQYFGKVAGTYKCSGELNIHWYDRSGRQDLQCELKEVKLKLQNSGKYKKPFETNEKLLKFCSDEEFTKRITNDSDEYGFRLDINKHAYLFRIKPCSAESQITCFVYQSEQLDTHIKEASFGISFKTRAGQNEFRIRDGGKISLNTKDDCYYEIECRYVDPFTAYIGWNTYHTNEFYDLMDDQKNIVKPIDPMLPKYCLTVSQVSGDLIILMYGEKGYFECSWSTDNKDKNRELADTENQRLGITKQQEKAMSYGSIFGWNNRGTNPDLYDKNGKMLVETKKEKVR